MLRYRNVSCIVVDPHFKGVERLKEIRQLRSLFVAIPMILYGGFADPDLPRKYGEAGIQRCIPSGAHEELLEAIKIAISTNGFQPDMSVFGINPEKCSPRLEHAIRLMLEEFRANPKAYQGAWGLNIRAYLFVMTQQGEKSKADAERAFVMLDQMTSHLKEFADNWAQFYRQNLQLDTSLAWALKGIKVALIDRDVFQEYICTVLAADLYYRIGKAAEAYSLIAKARERRAFLGDPSSLHDLGIATVSIYIRAGLLDEAKALLKQELGNEDTSIDKLAEVNVMMGLIAAMQGEDISAEYQINRAIELAVGSGERDTLLRVALLAGRCYQLLYRQEQAVEAYTQAVEIIESMELTDKLLPPENLVVSALIGYQETKGNNLDLIRQLLYLLPAALHHPETWWDLVRLLPILINTAQCIPTVFEDPELAEALSPFVKAVSQRADCAELLGKFQTLLPDTLPHS